MTNLTGSTLTEAEARDAWNERMNSHPGDPVTAAIDAANRDVSAARGLNPSDFYGHGAEGRTAWYLAAARYVDEHCHDCKIGA